ncbi:hypothetical protein ATANTOWER_032887, partial [Ataeniobius toweri]|nr:hypothetical protein [Ataeniobius toweri]
CVFSSGCNKKETTESQGKDMTSERVNSQLENKGQDGPNKIWSFRHLAITWPHPK